MAGLERFQREEGISLRLVYQMCCELFMLLNPSKPKDDLPNENVRHYSEVVYNGSGPAI